MKKRTKQILVIVGILILVYLLLQLKACHGKNLIQYWQDPNFKTDTIYVPQPYPVKGDSFPYQVKAKEVIIYLPSKDNGKKVRFNEDSLLVVIDSLGNMLAHVNDGFLTEYTEESKLIRGLFKSDTIKLDLLQINGYIVSKVYLTDFEHFKYKFENNEMMADSTHKSLIPSKPIKEKIKQSLYGYGGYELFNKMPIAQVEYYLDYKKLRLGVGPQVSIEKNPTLMLTAKLGFKIR